ncbi:MAG: hypothetical protein JNK65_04605, partial [Deltaproteobacteria bacterium]|nr:hypothetical protein [Deltaproteobacteria bacterium]
QPHSIKPNRKIEPSLHGKITGRPLPVLGKAACGRWEDFSDLEYPTGHADKWMVSISKDPNAFYIEAKGDSMIGGNINNGDLLLVEPNKEVFNGCKVLAKDPELGVTVKLFYKEKDKVRLQPMNPEYPPLFVKEKEDFRVYRITQKVSDL